MRKLSEMKSSIQGLESYSEEELIQQVRLKTEQVESDLGPGDFRVKQITIIGSRTRSEARPDSDLDVLVEYEGRLKEYAVFNILHEDPLYIEGILIDINPIRAEESGTTEEWLRRSEKYLESR
jgi:predicted nucleotidyltransferase